MRALKQGIVISTLAALAFTPLAGVYADPEPDPGLDYEACQSTDLSTVETYTVSFDTDGGTEIAPVVAPFNCSVREMGQVPADPTKDGYTFFGWYKSNNFEEVYSNMWTTFGEIPDGDITLYAHFIPNNKVITSVAFTTSTPTAGTEVTVTYETDPEWGAVFEYQEPVPAAVTTDTSYRVSYAAWTVVGGAEYEKFEGTFIEGEQYGIDITLEAEGEYRFSKNCTATVNGSPATVSANEYSAGQWATVSAALIAVAPDETYTVADSQGNSVTFDEADGHTYTFTAAQYSFSMTDEELAAASISREDYEAGKTAIISATSDQGSVVAYFEFEVRDELNAVISDGPFEVKIKFTDDMKGYDVYKLVYVNIDAQGNATTETAIELTLVDGYLVGTVPHFSGYVLLGTSNPQTGDRVAFYATMLALGFTGIVVLAGTRKASC